MKCRLRRVAGIAVAFLYFSSGGVPASWSPLGLCCAIPPLRAQQAAPFGERSEAEFRAQFEDVRRQPGFLPAGQRPGNAGANDFFDSQAEQRAPQNTLDTLNENSLYSDAPLETATENFERYEPRGGELDQRNLTTERRQERDQNNSDRFSARGENTGQDRQRGNGEASNNDDFETPDDRRSAGLETGRDDNFEDDFLAAERALDGDNADDLSENNEGRDLADAGTDASERQETEGRRLSAQQRRQPQGQRGTARGNNRVQNQRNLTLAQRRGENADDQDANDITGSIRPNAVEDPYAQTGKRIGAFRLFSELTITGLYSDNPTASPENRPGDEAIEFQPRFLLRSDWSRHQLEFEGQLTQSYYDQLSSENVEEWFLRSTGRIDIRRNQYLELEGRIENAQDDRGDIDAANTDSELATFETMALTALYHVELNRTTIEFSGNLTSYDYEDAVTSTGLVVNNDDQDYLETNASAILGYTFHTGFYIFTEGRYVNREYDSQLDDFGFARSSEGWSISEGVIYDLTAKLRLEASLGYQWLTPEDNRYVDLEEVIWSAALLYRPSEKTSLTLRAERGIEGTDIDGTVGLLETEYSISLDHYFRPHILVQGRLNYRIEDYLGLDLEQETFSTEIALQYILNRHARLITSYQFTDVETSDGLNYQENIIRLGVNLRP